MQVDQGTSGSPKNADTTNVAEEGVEGWRACNEGGRDGWEAVGGDGGREARAKMTSENEKLRGVEPVGAG